MSAAAAVALPAALRPWAEQLAWLDPVLQPEIGELMAGIALLLRPLRRPQRIGLEEPNGYDGLARKGQPQHLLLSEWALAQELPDEFMRRAAMHELLYLQPERVQQQPSHVCSVLLDTGPLQHGAPRLAQLAALLVMARRAAMVGADLRWGVLQAPGEPWESALSPDNARRWRAARAAGPVSQPDWRAWDERLAADAGAPGDLYETWVVGATRAIDYARELWPRCRAIGITQALAPDDGLVIRVAQDGAVREDLLPLPAPAVQVRLLRQPWRPDPVQSRPVDARPITEQLKDLALCFSPDGRHLAVRQPLGRALFYPLPEQISRTMLAGPRRVDRGFHPVLAMANWGGKKFIVLTEGDDGRIYMNRPGLWMRVAAPVEWLAAGGTVPAALPAEPLMEHGRLHQSVFVSRYGTEWLYLIDAGRRLWRFALAEAGQPPRLIREGMETVLVDTSELCGLSHSGRQGEGWTVFSVSLSDRDAAGVALAAGLHPDVEADAQVEWCGHVNGSRTWVLRTGERWVVGQYIESMGTPPPWSEPVPPDCRLLGVIQAAEGMSLLVLTEQALCSLREGRCRVLHGFEASIVGAEYRPHGGRVAAVDAHGVLHIYHLGKRAIEIAQPLYGVGVAHA